MSEFPLRVIKQCACGWGLNVAGTAKATKWATWEHNKHKDQCPLWGVPVNDANQYPHRAENRDAS